MGQNKWKWGVWCWMCFGVVTALAQTEDGKKIVFLAGPPSHGYGAHEHYAGCVLLAKKLEQAMPGYRTEVYRHDWPTDPQLLADADCLVMYSDGGRGHPVIPHVEEVEKLVERGVGIVCLHYAVEVPKGRMGDRFLTWLGGYFETDWSVNPHWVARFETFPDHPVARGITPFELQDEWYYHMRFRENMEGVTPILSALPPADTLSRPDGPHSGNPHVRAAVAKGLPQHVAWAAERSDGGRSFGFTGGHDHWNWGHAEFRKVVLNAIVWAAKGEVPPQGVAPSQVDLEALKENQDYPIPDKYDWERAAARLTPAK